MSDVLTELYADAARARGGRAHGPEGLHRGRPDGASRGTPDARDERERFARMRNAYMAVTPSVGRLLYQLARIHHATAVVEFGTSFGISTSKAKTS